MTYVSVIPAFTLFQAFSIETASIDRVAEGTDLGRSQGVPPGKASFQPLVKGPHAA